MRKIILLLFFAFLVVNVWGQNFTVPVKITTDSDSPLSFYNSDNSWQYMQFFWSGQRKVWMGMNGSNSFRIAKENGGNIAFTGANVGIGTTTPEADLEIVGTIGSGATALKVKSDGNSNDKVFHFIGNSVLEAYQMVMLQTGSVGIGTTSPGYKLDLIAPNSGLNIVGSNSRIYFNGKRAIEGKQDGTRMDIGEGYSDISFRNAGNVGIGTASPSADLEIIGKIGAGATALKVKSDGNSNDKVFHFIGNSALDSYQMVMLQTGKVGIGTTNPTYKLTVDGTIGCEEVKVEIISGADFVFDDNYELRSIEEVADYVKTEKHLPEIASAQEMQNNGIGVAEMNMKLLQKIEELTLYVIEMSSEIETLKEKNKNFEERLNNN